MADSLASQIITAIGGPENVRSLTHCATRLRFELADASKVDQNALEHMKGVLGAVPQSGDRFQVVIGGGVATVYENIMHLPEMANAGAASASGEGQKSNADVKAEARSKARGKVAWLDSFFEYLADSFRPILGVLLGDFRNVKRVPFEQAVKSDLVERFDFREHYVADLENVIDFDVIRSSGVRLGIDPLGGASVNYWPLMNEKYNLTIDAVRPQVDPTWSFMTIDHDGKIRMDPSSPYAMKGLVDSLNNGAWDKYDLVGGTDPDADRHGIVCPNWGVMNPNHYIAVCVEYLFGGNRPDWPENAGIGKTLVSSSLIDRVAASINAKLVEVPVGFKWFVDPLFKGEVAFGGEESSGMSFLRKDGRVWTTDKDGLIPDLLAAEITAKTGKNPAQLHQEQVERFGESWYKRVDTPTTLEQKQKFAKLTGDDVEATQLAGEDITAKLTEAPGNHAKIGGLKVTTKDNWFAARPSGTENIYKVYAESFESPEALDKVLAEATEVVDKALAE